MASELQPTVDADLAALQKAMDTASESTLRYGLRSICLNIPEAQERAGWSLLVDAAKKRQVGQSDFDTNGSEVSVSEVSDWPSDSHDSDETYGDSDDEQYSGPRLAAQAELATPKIRVLRYAFCTNCKDEFEVTENKSTSCRYHPEFSCCGETVASNPEKCEVDWHGEGAPERKVKRVRTWDYQPSF